MDLRAVDSRVLARVIALGCASALLGVAAPARAQVKEPLPAPGPPPTEGPPVLLVPQPAPPVVAVEGPKPAAKQPVGGDAEFDGLYFRGSSTHVQGGGADVRDGFGFTVGSELWGTFNQRWFAFHYDYDLLLGGGGNGLEGKFEMRATFGARIPVTSRFGPYVRVGLGGDYQGNDWYLYSHFDAPVAQAGASYVASGYSVEAGAQTAYTVAGRYITGVASRRVLDSAPTVGGYADVHLLPVVLRAEYTDYSQASPGAPLAAWTTHGCLVFPIAEAPAAYPVEACFDGAWLSGGVVPRGGTAVLTSDVFYYGVSIGFGFGVASPRVNEPGAKAPARESSPAPSSPPTGTSAPAGGDRPPDGGTVLAPR
jgi:hypothetical protein